MSANDLFIRYAAKHGKAGSLDRLVWEAYRRGRLDERVAQGKAAPATIQWWERTHRDFVVWKATNFTPKEN